MVGGGGSKDKWEVALLAKEKVYFAFPLRVPDEVQGFFNELIRYPWACNRELRVCNPEIYLYETDEAFILEAYVPGAYADDVRVYIDGVDLIVQGQGALARHGKAREFMRRIPLPELVGETAITAKLNDGVLRVLIVKTKRRDKPCA